MNFYIIHDAKQLKKNKNNQNPRRKADQGYEHKYI